MINFAFWGTPDVASETLEILKQAGFLPSLIVASPDAKKGRGLQISPSPVSEFATKNNIPCLKPEKLDQEFTLKLSTFNVQLFIVVAYGKIMPEKIINMPKFDSLNIHYSLLPKYRGASPVESAILNGETKTGVTIQQMVFEMDAGPIIMQEETIILPDEKASDLRKRLIKQGGELLVKTLNTPSVLSIINREVPKAAGVKQDESKVTFCKKIKKEDGLVDLEAELPSSLYNKFRAYAFWPRTFFFQNGKRIIITDAKLIDGKFEIQKVLPEGKKEISYEQFKANASK